MFKNTTDFWQVVGKENPYWGVATHDKFLGAELSQSLSCEFFQSGAVEINSSLNLLHWLCGFKGTPGNAIDFGCGVGRLTIHMAKVMGHVYGVDVSSGMLDKARKHVAENGLQNISFSTIIPDIEADWINSFIVFQHIPPKEGYSLLAKLLSHLRGGGYSRYILQYIRLGKCIKNSVILLLMVIALNFMMIFMCLKCLFIVMMRLMYLKSFIQTI